MEYTAGKSLRNRTLVIVTLVAVGIAIGSIFLYVESLSETKDILILDFINGKIILDPEERELVTQRVLNITLENEQVQAVTAGKNFTTQIALAKFIQELEETSANGLRRIYIEFEYIAVVTLTFEDGSGYQIPVNWEDWTVGEPEYSEQASPPDSIIRIGPPETRERRGT